MKIRYYATSDYLEVRSLLQEAGLFDEIWDSEENIKGIAKNGSALLAEDNGQILGCIFVVPYGTKVSYLFRLAVKKEQRKKGIGSQLLDKAEQIIKSGKNEEVGLYVDSDNKTLQQFYKKRGYKTSGKPYFYMWKETE
jgi:ribosomal protein S18 acetylase RimI-like enzyme